MSTFSPNFNLVLATSGDLVNVVTHVAGNFSSLDTLLFVAHTGTGQLRSGLTIPSPIISNPTFSGTASGFTTVIATTGRFNTITATGGLLTVNTFNIGTYGFPGAIGSTSAILTVVTGNAQWAASAPNTGANQALSNLTTVALNTGIGTGSGGFLTFDRIVASSGALTGLTVFQASTGTFAGNVSITGTLTANVVNCTGGAITAGGITVGTYALPATIGSSGQVLTVGTNTLGFNTPFIQTAFSYILSSSGFNGFADGTAVGIPYVTELYDLGGNASAGVFTAPSSGIYEFNFAFSYIKAVSPGATPIARAGLVINTTEYAVQYTTYVNTGTGVGLVTVVGCIINTVANGAVVKPFLRMDTGSNSFTILTTASASGAAVAGHFSGKRIYEF